MDTPQSPRPPHTHAAKSRAYGGAPPADQAPPAVSPPHTPPPVEESFFRKQLKLASSTAIVSSVATLSISFWSGLAFYAMFSGLILLALFSAIGTGDGTSAGHVFGKAGAEHRLLSIKLTGPIEGVGGGDGGGLGSLFGSSQAIYGYDVKERLLAAIKEKYDGIILEVDSPGGTIYGAKAVSDGIEQYRQATHNPVYTHVQGFAASGAYWIAASSTKILADSGTGIGSIGVIFGPFTYYNQPTAVDGGLLSGGVVTQGGIEESYVTAGEGKDAGNPYRRLTDKELGIFQESVNDNYAQFVKHVSKGRGISEATIRTDIGAHLYGEEGALRRKLIDGIASREQAYTQLATAAGLKWGHYEVVDDMDAPEGGLAGFGARLFGTPARNGSGTAAKTTGAPAICTQAATPLVYQGNLMQLCGGSK